MTLRNAVAASRKLTRLTNAMLFYGEAKRYFEPKSALRHETKRAFARAIRRTKRDHIAEGLAE